MRKYLMGLFVAFFAIAAAAQNEACLALVQEVSQALEDNCSNLPNNSVCYGYYDVQSQFSAPVDFAQPADVASIDGLISLQTAPFDEASGRWGIALLQTQASLPNTLPGQSVTFMLLGDSSLTTAQEEATFVPAEPIMVTSQINANIRLSPSNEGTIIASIAAGTELPADAQNNGWYRVVVDEQMGWIAAAVIDAPEGLADLPFYSSESRATMQAFYFTTGIGQPSCESAPNEILIQGTDETVLNITVNGVEISTSGATIGLSNPEEGAMQISVLDGIVEVDGLVIPPNYAATGDLDEGNNFVSGSMGGSRALTQAERDKYESLRESGINSVFSIPEIHDTPQIVPTATEASAEAGSGETGTSGGSSEGGSTSPAPTTVAPVETVEPTDDGEVDCVQPPCDDDGK